MNQQTPGVPNDCAERIAWAVNRLQAVVDANSGRQQMGSRHATRRVVRDVIAMLEGRMLLPHTAKATGQEVAT